MLTHIVRWLDIPVKDLDRASLFYERILSQKIIRKKYEAGEYAYFGHSKEGEVGACLILSDTMVPRKDGFLPYFNVDERHKEAEESVEENGGTILQTKHSMGEYGFRTIILDTEGNRIALHSKL